MQPYKFVLFFIFYTLASCSESRNKINYPTSDTAKVLELAIRTAFYHHSLPEDNALAIPYHFHDSILFTSKSLPLNFLPNNIDSLNFKILPESEICSIISADSNISHLPNYLIVAGFEKTDTGYIIQVGSFSCKKYGGGGIIGIYIAKRNDSFFVKYKGSSSIN